MSIKRRSRNGAFLIELLTVIAIFAVCAAACVRVIGIAASEMKYAERLSDAQIKTADIAECYKAAKAYLNCHSDMPTATSGYSFPKEHQETYSTLTSPPRTMKTHISP